MANSILKLRVESNEYDAKLKKAAEGIQHLAEAAHRSGGELTNLEKSELDYVKALGDMETKSRSAAGKVRELESTFKELTVVYNQLNDVEKADEGGKALAASLEKLKERAAEAKRQLNDASRALNENTDAGMQDGSMLDQLAGKFTMNIDVLKLFNVGLQAAGAALDVAKEAFFKNEENLDEWGRTVESAKSLYSGFLDALNTGDISGYLNNINSITKAARDAYDALDELATYNAFNQINVARSQTAMTESIANYRSGQGSKEEVQAAGTAYKNELQERQALEQDAYNKKIKEYAAERGIAEQDLIDALSGTYGHYKELKSVMPTGSELVFYGGGITGGGGGSYEKAVPQGREEELGAALRRFNDTELEALQGLGAKAQQTANEIANVDKQLTRVLNSTPKVDKKETQQAADDVRKAEKAYADAMANASGKLETNIVTQEQYDQMVLKGQQSLADAYQKAYNITGDEKYLSAFRELAPKIAEYQDVVKQNIEAQKQAEQSARALEAAQKKLADAQNALAEAQASGDLKQIYAAQSGVESAQKNLNYVQSSITAPAAVSEAAMPSAGGAVPVEVKFTKGNLDAFIAELKQDMGSAEIGSELLTQLQEQLSDASAISAILQTAIQNGLDTADFGEVNLLQKIMSGDISDDEIAGYVEQLNELLKSKFDETEWPEVMLKFDVDSKKIEQAAKEQQKDSKNLAKDWQDAGNAISAVGAAMETIKNPAAKVIGTIAQAIGSVAMGAGAAIAKAGESGNPWAWIAFAAAATATMITTISSIHNATGYANGGIVGGNSFSGDNVQGLVDGVTPVGLNSGEVILNKAQSNTIASLLQESEDGSRGMSSQPYLTGETIWLGLSNYLRSSGRGELVLSRG